MRSRYAILDEIRTLHPERDNQRIMHLSFGYEFSWDSVRALEVALYRTYASPRVSGLLDRTGEFRQNTQRRYDDTAILIAEICKYGYEQGRGRDALERMNWAHGHFKIANEDFLYVLSTFIFEPIRWIDEFGWRRLCGNERLAYYYFWREVGTRMGISEIPESFDAFAKWSTDYEAAHFRFDETNQRIASSTRDLFASWFPRILTPIVRYSIYALLDDALIEAFGFPRPLPGMRTMTRAALKARGGLVRWLPPRRTPHFFMDGPNRTYPAGYEIAKLGPQRLIEREEKRRAR